MASSLSAASGPAVGQVIVPQAGLSFTFISTSYQTQLTPHTRVTWSGVGGWGRA